MKVVYIAGPFRADTPWKMELNVREAEYLALQVWRSGAAAICPHANTRYFQGALPDDVWLRGDLEILERCDAVVVTEDWGSSLGAIEEVISAVRLNIPVFTYFIAYKLWLEYGIIKENQEAILQKALQLREANRAEAGA